MKDVYEELKALTSISAISGCEDNFIAELKERLKNTGSEIHVDKLGNVTSTFKGTETPDISILFLAHMDELGLIVKLIDGNGFLKVERVGGIPEKTLLGSFVDVHTLDYKKSFTGFFGAYSHHLTPAEKKMTIPAIKDLYIDIGCESRQEVLDLGINVGSMITYAPTYQKLGKNRLTAKSLDDRMGVYILLRMAEYFIKTPPKATVHLCFSVQEEFSVRGCMPVFERLMPDASVCLDITPAYDTPELKGGGEIDLGKGPAILYFNFHGRGTLGGLIPHPKLTRFIEDTAKGLGISCQHDVVVGVITDDAFTQLMGKEGVPTAHISVPCRYTHAPVETIDLRDLEQAVELSCRAAVRFDGDVDLSRG